MSMSLTLTGKIVIATALISISLAVAQVFEDDIDYLFDKVTFRVPSEIAGIELGDLRSDVVFKLGEPSSDFYKVLVGRDVGDDSETLRVAFREDRVVRLDTGSLWGDYPLRDTERLLGIMGEPDIYAVSGNYLIRTYSYINEGFTINYFEDRATNYWLGETDWGTEGQMFNLGLKGVPPLSEYRVSGKQICPGESCPFK